MKTRILYLACLAALVVLLPAMLQAQLVRQPMMQIDIPFPFVAGGVHLPAGHYHVYHPGDPYAVVLERDDGKARAMTWVHPSATASDDASTKLVFNKYGDQHFLAQVWTEHDREVHQCHRCRMEQTLMAQAPKPELIVVAAKR